MALPLPAWFRKKKWSSRAEREAAQLRFYIRVAAIYATEHGGTTNLSEHIGLSRSALSSIMLSNRGLSPETAIAIEKAAGREFVSREVLRPDLFELPDDDET